MPYVQIVGGVLVGAITSSQRGLQVPYEIGKCK